MNFFKYFILLSLFMASFGGFGQKSLNTKEIEKSLSERDAYWKISIIWERELTETGPVGELKKVELSSSLAALMANTGLVDSIVFKNMYLFADGYFSGKVWQGSSGDLVHWETLSGLWKLKKNSLIWEIPDNAYLPESIVFKEFEKDFFIIEGSVEYGTEAFRYFEYKVQYDKNKHNI